ncbi:hypothetical protein Q0N12_19520 [Rossellomorea marisflavi]|uniref:hypothetical protein n=1 Tax=Rossellomorea marisflavi TaxID=189381 RepID=UPI0034580776
MNRLGLNKKSLLLRTFITNNGENNDEKYERLSSSKENVEINIEKYKNDPEFYEIVKEMIFYVDQDDRPSIYIICNMINLITSKTLTTKKQRSKIKGTLLFFSRVRN